MVLLTYAKAYIATGMGGGPNANVELLLAAKGNLPDEPWSSDDKPPPFIVPISRDGFYAIVRGGSVYRFTIPPIPDHTYGALMEYDDSHSFTTYILTDLTLGRREVWGTYLLYWNDSLKGFGASEENHRKHPCRDRECDSIDIQPWRVGPWSVMTTGIATRPVWKVKYEPVPVRCTPPDCYYNINLNYICLYMGNKEKACNERQQRRHSNSCFSEIGEIPCPKFA
ncbi:MAG: hypothetical protein WBZ36_10320 [Candidatus Nitrosopolaris sp.]